MRDVRIKVEGLTPYSSSLNVIEELQKGETKDAHEQRRWREKAHADDEGNVFIPGMCFKLALDRAAMQIGEKIKGRGNKTYVGLFMAGTVAMSDMHLGLKVEDLQSIRIFANADGKRGSGTRVFRWFPYVPTWGGEFDMKIFDDTIPEEVFERYFAQAGLTAGVGRGRPETGCPAGNGRFRPVEFRWS